MDTDLRAFAIEMGGVTYWLVIDRGELLFCTVSDKKGDEKVYRKVRKILDSTLEYKEKKKLTIERPGCHEMANIVHIYRFGDNKSAQYAKIKKELKQLKESL